MSKLYEDLEKGLNEAIDYEKSAGQAKITTLSIAPAKEYTNNDIKTIRNNAGMTQKVFATFMGVSQKTVEAWECGTSHPNGPARRLMEILSSGGIKDVSFVSFE